MWQQDLAILSPEGSRDRISAVSNNLARLSVSFVLKGTFFSAVIAKMQGEKSAFLSRELRDLPKPLGLPFLCL